MDIYFAGDLFDFKHLAGNALLAEKIGEVSKGKYRALLPQDHEANKARKTSIRNMDLDLLFSCDAALFNFDGTDLDSGTVVEFMFAKFLDIPSVLLRTDFRHAGDQKANSDPWNLMCSGYPRSVTLKINSMEHYHRHIGKKKRVDSYVAWLAGEIICDIDKACAAPSLFKGDTAKAAEVYSWAVKTAGSGLERVITDSKIRKIIRKKHKLGLI